MKETGVVDISGDGSNNDGRPVKDARDDAIAAGLTINGLPISSEERDLLDYFRANVIGGPGSFVIEVQDFSHFAEAILRKLVLEIARLDNDTGAAVPSLARRLNAENRNKP